MKLLKTITTVLVLLLSASLYAQTQGTIRGKVLDSMARPLKLATVSILNSTDSVLVQYALSKEDGSFAIEKIELGTYFLQVSYSGLSPLWLKFSLSAAQPEYNFGNLSLLPSSKMMDEVVIKSVPIAVNGDTLEFNASHFKTIPNATTEDLLKKLPGVEVEKDGSVKSNGEAVTRVMVDGKRFFGDDPKMATRNLPADIIEKIQVIDAMSEQSEFTGFDDGNRVKTINIVTKKDRRKGVFGKASLAAGTEDRTANALSANRFNGNQQISLVGQYNNVNNQNFTVQDFLGSMASNAGGGGGGRGGGGGGLRTATGSDGGGGNPFAGVSGLSTTKSAGINYSDAWSSRTLVNGSYFFNNVDAGNNRDRYRETFSTYDSSLFNSSRYFSETANTNHRFNFEIDHRFDSLNSILVRPNYSHQSTDSYSETNSVTTKGKLTPLSEVLSKVNSNNEGYNLSNSILYRRRFNKRGRTLSLNLTQGTNTNDRNSTNLSYTTNSRGNDTLDQISSTIRDGRSWGANLSFTERMGIRSQMELSYSYNRNENNSDQQTYSLNDLTDTYDIVMPNRTNKFENSNVSQRVGVNYRVQVNPEWNYFVGMAVQYAELSSQNHTKETLLSQSYYNLFPNFTIQYRKSRARSMRFSYRGSTQQPSITQLQDVIDDNNVLFIRSGNPALKQEFNNGFTLNYNSVNIQNFHSLSIGINGSRVSNKIATTNTLNTSTDSILVDGYKLGPAAQFSKPENLNGAFSFGGNVNYSMPIKKPKMNLNISGRFNYIRDVNLLRDATLVDILSYTRNYVFGGGIRLNMNVKERFDLNFSSNSTYTLARYSTSNEQNGDYFTQRFSIEPTFITKKGWILSNDFDYILNKGQSDGYNQSIPLWNAGVARMFLKNKQAEVRLSVFDILNQNQSITRTTELNYVEDVKTQVLKRYFLLSFTYNLRRFKGGQQMNNRNNFGNRQGMGGGGMRGRVRN
jgi:hypothetical protein